MTRLRRDPRAALAALAVVGGSRPRFDRSRRAAARRPRSDPRAEQAAVQVASPARVRLDRAAPCETRAPVAVGTTAAVAAPSLLILDAPAFLVAVAIDAPGGRLSPHDRQVLGAARRLAADTGAIVVIGASAPDDLGSAGADRFIGLGPTDGFDSDGTAASIVAVCQSLSPRHILFPETASGGDLARRVAVSLGAPLFANAEAVTANSVTRAARGQRIEQRAAPSRLLTIAADASAPYDGPPREARALKSDWDVRASCSAILSAVEIPADPAHVPLALADFVTAAGNGVTDFDMFHALVAALAATPGASRVLCDSGVMPRATQVGASGTVLAATCYFALGIAGAPQHLQGIAGCEHVVAVNTDLHAAMIERAGLAIVQDAQLVMPALLAELAREAEQVA